MLKKQTIVLSLIAAGLILIGVFIAFNYNRQNTNLLSQLEEGGASAKKLTDVKLTFYFSGKEPKVAREVLDRVEQKAKDLHIKLDFKFIAGNPESYLNQIKALTSSNSPCDAYYYSSGFPKDLRTIVKEGMAKDITQLFPLCAPNYYRGFSQEEINAASVNNRIYAIPQRYPSTQMRCAMVQEDLMKKYHLPDIKNYDDYEVYLKTIKENEPGITPMVYWESSIGLFAEANGYVVLNYALGLVYKWNDPRMQILPWEQTSEYRRGIKTILKWKDNGYILSGLYLAQIDDTVISSGKFASFIGTLDWELRANTILKSKNINWRYKAYPLYPDKIAERNSPLVGAMIISPHSKNAERCLMLINWLQSKQENYDSLMYGIEGKHYLLEGECISLPEDVKPEQSFSSWTWRWPFDNIDFERPDISNSADLIKKYADTIKTKAKYPPHIGFNPDLGSLSSTVSLRRSSFFTGELLYVYGAFKPSDIDTYITEQKTQGVGKLVAEVQRQLDKWRMENKDSTLVP